MERTNRTFRRSRRAAGDVEPFIAMGLVLVVIGLVVSLILFRKAKPPVRPPVASPGSAAPTTPGQTPGVTVREPTKTPAVGEGPGMPGSAASEPSLGTPPATTPGKGPSTVPGTTPSTAPNPAGESTAPAKMPKDQPRATPEARNKSKKAAERGRAFVAKGDFVEAVKCFEEAVDLLAPEQDGKLRAEFSDARAERDSRSLLLAASAAEERGDMAAALRSAEGAYKAKAREETNALIARLRSALLTEDGRKKENAHDLAGALAAYRDAEKLHQSAELSDRIAEVEGKIKAEEAAAAKAKYDELVSKAKAAEKDEDFFTAVLHYEEACRYAAKKEEIETLLAAATRQREDCSTLFNMWLTRGNDHMRAGLWGEAIAAFERAQKYNKTEPTIVSLIRDAREKAILQDMVLVPAGEFLAGETRTPCTLKAFYIDRFEVTNKHYKSFVGATGHQPPRAWARGSFPAGEENLPVTGISWEDAVVYAAWAGKRLPSESEWEKAARGTDGRVYPWGNEFTAAKCNSAEQNAAKAVAVGTAPGDSSPYDIKDLAGNAIEWTSTIVEAGVDAESKQAVLKGASFLLPGAQAGRAFARRTDDRDLRMVGYGFRCARDAE